MPNTVSVSHLIYFAGFILQLLVFYNEIMESSLKVQHIKSPSSAVSGVL